VAYTRLLEMMPNSKQATHIFSNLGPMKKIPNSIQLEANQILKNAISSLSHQLLEKQQKKFALGTLALILCLAPNSTTFIAEDTNFLQNCLQFLGSVDSEVFSLFLSNPSFQKINKQINKNKKLKIIK